MKSNIRKALFAQKICKVLPPFLSYRVHHRYFNDLVGSGIPFVGKALFGKIKIPMVMNDIVDVHFALHQTMNYSGMVIASVVINTGDVVFDIGANLGTETLAMSNLVGVGGRVVAVEADPDTVNILHSRVERGNFTNVIVENKAVAKKRGVMNIVRCSKLNVGMNYVKDAVVDGGAMVEAITADDLISVFGEPSFVFMDIEGSEYGFFQGGVRLLSNVRPTIFTEVNASMLLRAGGTIQKFVKILDEHQYTAFDAHSRYLKKIILSQVDRGVCSDWLLIPNEKIGTVKRIRNSLVLARIMPRVWRFNPLDRLPCKLKRKFTDE